MCDDLGLRVLGLRVMTPLASERTAFEEDGGPNAGSVVNREMLDIEYEPRLQAHDIKKYNSEGWIKPFTRQKGYADPSFHYDLNWIKATWLHTHPEPRLQAAGDDQLREKSGGGEHTLANTETYRIIVDHFKGYDTVMAEYVVKAN
jgi:hypothetical protein